MLSWGMIWPGFRTRYEKCKSYIRYYEKGECFMSMSIVAGLLIPFLGTTAGAACVFFLKKQIGGNIQIIFT